MQFGLNDIFELLNPHLNQFSIFDLFYILLSSIGTLIIIFAYFHISKLKNEIEKSLLIEKELKNSKDNLRKILSSSIEGIAVIKEAKMLRVNDTLLKMLGYDDLISIKDLNIFSLIPDNYVKLVQNNMKKKETHSYEIELKKRDGSLFPVLIKGIDLVEKDYMLRIVYVVDLSELKEKETLLINQSRTSIMGEMLSMIAHQWRQPLSAITSTTMAIETKINTKRIDYKTDDGINLHEKYLFDKIDKINSYAQYLTTTIDDFKNFFMPEKEKHEVELSSVIERSLSLISHLIENKNIKIIKHFNLVPNVVIYENELIQVVINILTNAIDALEEKTQKTPTITLRLFQNDEDEIFITISDNAGGISKNIIDNVFDLYFSTKSKNGTGLGLYMSKIIVEKHLLGNICVKNTPYGAKFIIVLNQKKILQHRCEKLNG